MGVAEGVGAQGRNRTGTVFLPRDFKSLVSTNFTTWADIGELELEAEVGIKPAYTELQSAA